MMPPPEPSTQERQLHELLLGYVEAVERGERPDRGEFLARHPEFAAELAEFFAGQDRFDSLAAAVCTPTPTNTPLFAPTEAPAQSFGDYEILEELGRGGMGAVFKARQRSLSRTVALKMILPGRFASPAEVAREVWLPLEERWDDATGNQGRIGPKGVGGKEHAVEGT